jgi:hypothetical protein
MNVRTALISGAWTKMRKRAIDPTAQRVMTSVGEPINEVWSNDVYECMVRYLSPQGKSGPLHLSIKRLDRGAIRDWRHVQSIKNEVAGPEREAVELYPAESRLVDQANQTHLWVMDEGVELPIGYRERVVKTQEQSRADMTARGVPDNGKGRQRGWQPGLSTGPEAA